jgi:hypothetical protein
MSVERKHKCPVDVCQVAVGQKFLMCAEHWALVPRTVQDWVNREYRKGFTAEYFKARAEAIKEVNLQIGERRADNAEAAEWKKRNAESAERGKQRELDLGAGMSVPAKGMRAVWD